MKRTALFIAAIAIIITLLTVCTSCTSKEKEVERTTLITEDFAVEYPDWQLSNDTIVKDFTLLMGLEKEYPIPFRLTWVNAIDTEGIDLYNIAYYKLERLGGTDKVKINNAVIAGGSCCLEGDNDKIIESFLLGIKFNIGEANEVYQILFNAVGDCVDINKNNAPLGE